jgi:hypothetical protein
MLKAEESRQCLILNPPSLLSNIMVSPLRSF